MKNIEVLDGEIQPSREELTEAGKAATLFFEKLNGEESQIQKLIIGFGKGRLDSLQIQFTVIIEGERSVTAVFDNYGYVNSGKQMSTLLAIAVRERKDKIQNAAI